MQVIAGTREFQIKEPTVVTIGKFDGRHKGHQKLLQRMLLLGKQKGFRTAIFTFDGAGWCGVREEAVADYDKCGTTEQYGKNRDRLSGRVSL